MTSPDLRSPVKPPTGRRDARLRHRRGAGFGGFGEFVDDFDRAVAAAGAGHQEGDQRGPAGLVAGAQTLAAVAVEELVEEDEVFPVRVLGEARVVAAARPPPLLLAFLVAEEEF